MKVLFTGNYTLDFIAGSFDNLCKTNNIAIQVVKSGFNQYKQDILSKQSDLNKGAYNIVYLCLELYTIIEDLIYQNEANSIEKMTERLAEEISLIKSLCQNLPSCHFFIDGFYYFRNISMTPMEYNSVYSISEIESISNRMLQKILENDSNATIVDVLSLIKSKGADILFDDRMYYIAKSHWSLAGIDDISNLYLRYLKAYLGIRKKCIVVDLDNTLWGGIIGDDGIDNIVLSNDGQGKAFYDFQRELLKLHKRGILLAINSKNTEEIAINALDNHPYMLLRSNYFVCKKINWKNKAQNMSEIADELNIGLDSIVFFDDSPAEREIIIKQCPQVFTPKMPEDPAGYAKLLRETTVFDLLNLTDSDLNRNKDYIINIHRDEIKSTFNNMEDYLASLNMIATIGRIGSTQIPRIAQMTQKTNQFNLRTIRYSEQEIKAFISNPGYRVYYLSLADKFGDNGIVGTAIVSLKENYAFFDTFLLSCRVLGRTVETAFLNHIISDISKNKIDSALGEYIKTTKNMPCSDFYMEHGFIKQSDTEWAIICTDYYAKPLPWIKIVERNYDE